MSNVGLVGVTVTNTSVAMTAQETSVLVKDRWTLSSARKNDLGQLVLVFERGVTGCLFADQSPKSSYKRWNKNRASFSGASHLPTFGLTKPAVTSLSIDGNELTVTMPKELAPYIPRTVKRRKGGVETPPDTLADMAGVKLSEVRLRDLIQEVNRRKDEMGEDLALSVTAEGRLRATLEYGG